MHRRQKDSWLSPEQPNKDKLCYAETPDGKEQIYKTDDAVDQKSGKRHSRLHLNGWKKRDIQ